MSRTFTIGLAPALLALFSSGASAATIGYTLNLSVALNCTVQHKSTGAGAVSGNAVMLGELDEYCNAATGYQLTVNYTPGSLQGAVIMLGDDRVVLNGSGNAIVSTAPGPRIRARTLSAIPGQAGFDTDHLDFQVQPV